MNKALYVIIFLSLAAVIGYLFGVEMRSGNPDGVWLSTPPVDDSGESSNSFIVGFGIGMLLMSLTYLALSVTIFCWSKLKSTPIFSLFWPLFVSSVIGLVSLLFLAGRV